MPPEKVEEVRNYLDYREKVRGPLLPACTRLLIFEIFSSFLGDHQGGYTVHAVDIYGDEDHHTPILKGATVYVGTVENPNYLGPAPLEDIARQIATSVGPSGPNPEYLFQLSAAMRELAPTAQDDHLFGLEALVRKLLEHTVNG